MKPRCSTQTNRAFNAFEGLVIVAAVLLLLGLLLPLTGHTHRVRSGINCVMNLKQAGLAFRIWEGDNNNLYPMAVSTSIGGAEELTAANNVAGIFLVMSNELSNPFILHCPVDASHTMTRSFGPGFNRSHISYFVNVDVTNDSDPHSILVGDDDFIASGLAVKSGLAELNTNMTVQWSGSRHEYGGNLGFADGSVREIMAADLQRTFVETGAATNRFVIP
jgi:prepilin-type processing-associated H-X9-DG protein